jgi:hypothetical protein
VTPEAAAWVRTVVLARQDPETLRALVDHCACQGGLPDHCKPGGKHELCAHHGRTPGYPRPSPETYLTRNHRVLALVWRVGKPCIWHCPCTVCAAAPALPGMELAGARTHRHGTEVPGRSAPSDEQLSLFDLAGAA